MRNLLRKELETIKAPGNWEHVTGQIGMFSFTGLTVAQSDSMVNKHHIYMTKKAEYQYADSPVLIFHMWLDVSKMSLKIIDS